MSGPVRVAIVGCGNIAGPYAATITTFPETTLVGVVDVDAARAEAFAAEHACQVYPTLDALLADDGVDLVVNLTIHHAHEAVTRRCLEAGKHVYSEKPLAMTFEQGHALVELAERCGRRLGCSPFAFMGEAPQTAWKAIRDGAIGQVRLVYADVNHGRIETWHPAPAPFYQVGPLFDVGVYPLALVTAMFGPARRVSAYGRVLHAERVTKDGSPFTVEAPDCVIASLELETGVLVRLTTNFYVGKQGRQVGVEFHGDTGSLHLSDWQRPDAEVAVAPYGGTYEPVALLRPSSGMTWGLGVRELAQALLEQRPHRASGEHAAHVVEILAAIDRSVREGCATDVRSTFSPPAPMPWAAGGPT